MNSENRKCERFMYFLGVWSGWLASECTQQFMKIKIFGYFISWGCLLLYTFYITSNGLLTRIVKILMKPKIMFVPEFINTGCPMISVFLGHPFSPTYVDGYVHFLRDHQA